MPTKIFVEQKWLKGNGPWYSLSIDEEGIVEYNGINNVKTLGKKLGYIKKDDLNELADDAKAVYFFSLRDEYGDILKYPDSCQTSISISLENRFKKITYLNDSKVPRSVVFLVKKIDRVTNVLPWVGSL